MGTRYLISEAACMSIGNGPMVAQSGYGRIYGFRISHSQRRVNPDETLLVSQLLNSDNSGRDIQQLRQWFGNATIELIWHIPISPNYLEDRWTWILDPLKFREFNVKTAYWIFGGLPKIICLDSLKLLISLVLQPKFGSPQ